MNTQPAVLPANDFPDWISPMLVKELRQGMRTKVFVFSFILLQILMTLNVVIGLLSTANGVDASAVSGVYWMMVSVPVVLVLPFLGLGALSGERAANTLDLIFLTRLSAWRIVIGKWFAIVAQTGLFVCAVLPYAVLRYFMGGLNLSVELFALAIMMLGSAVLTAVTVGLSPFQTRVTRVLSILGLIFGGFVLLTFGSSRIFMGMGMVAGPSTGDLWKFWLTVILFSVMVIVLMLQIGAAKIAPDAENHSAAKRFIGLGFFAVAMIMVALGTNPEATLTFALVCCVPVLIGAVCDQVVPNQGAYRAFLRRGKPGRMLGRMFYPGWPAGIIYAVALLGAFGAALYSYKMLANDMPLLVFAGAVGLIFFPAAITRLLFRRTQNPLPFFIGTVAVCGVFTILGGILDGIFNTEIRTFICLLPPCAFIQSLLGIVEGPQVSPAFSLCVAGTALSIAVIFGLSLSEWRRISAIEKIVETPADEPVA
jgi:hypothetical protein